VIAEMVWSSSGTVISWPQRRYLSPLRPCAAAAIKPWHERLAWLMALLVLLHLAAALKHQFIDRDGTLGRMLPH
jgi:cytochrome b561